MKIDEAKKRQIVRNNNEEAQAMIDTSSSGQ
jgi:hypothetical protein